MKRTQPAPTNFIATMTAHAKADPKKTIVLALLLVVLVVMVARVALSSAGPSSASAAAPQAQPGGTIAPAVETVDPLAARAVEQESLRQQRRDAYIEQVGRDLTRDLFELDVTAYPPSEGQVTAQADPQEQVDHQALAAEAAAEAERMRRIAEQAQREMIRSRAQALKLQSILGGRNPTAIINDEVVGVGDVIGGFEILRISQSECVIAQEGVEVSLRMEQP